MDILHPCCCGLDVHKQSITASVVWKESRTQRKVEKRVFGTMTRDLIALRDWLRDCGVTHVAMESTGVYWKPVWNVLEPDFDLLLANAQHVKALPGQKTDQKDSEWIADLLQHGLLKKSFVPPVQIRELRDLTRYRVCLAEECNRVANRIQKVLEDANIKLASVASDVLGASGRAMLKIIVCGDFNIDATAELARGRLRNKIPELQLALEGKVTEHHRFLLRELLDHLEFLEAKILHLEQEIADRTQALGDAVVRLCTIPGVSHIAAWGLVAEIGTDMSRFPTAQHLASWAGLCPGQHESAGKRKNTRTRKGGRLAAAMPVSMCLGRFKEENDLSLGSLPPLGGPARRQASRRWSGACHIGDRLSPLGSTGRVSGSRGHLPRSDQS
jgi:transposase